MTKQEQIIKWIEQDAAEIGATVAIQRMDYGNAIVEVTADDAGLFVIIGKRGGYRFLLTREPIGFGDHLKRGITQFRVNMFFEAVKRQRIMINEKAAA